MKKVINTTGYKTSSGFAAQITLPNGKYMYVGVKSAASDIAKENKWKIKTVQYFGACTYMNMNNRAHNDFPIQIDEVNVKDFLDKIATDEEFFEVI